MMKIEFFDFFPDGLAAIKSLFLNFFKYLKTLCFVGLVHVPVNHIFFRKITATLKKNLIKEYI